MSAFFPGFDAAGLAGDAERRRTTHGGQPEHLQRGHGRRAVHRLLDERREPHLLEHIQRVVARCAVSAQRYRDAACKVPRDRGDAGTEFQIGRWTMQDPRLMTRHQVHFMVVQPDAVRETGDLVQDPQLREVLDVVHPAARPHRFQFVPVLRRVRMKEHPRERACHGVCFTEERIAARQDEPRSNGIPDAAAGTAVPLLRLPQRRCQRIFGALPERRMQSR